MKPYAETDGARLYLGRAHEVVDNLDRESVQTIVTSPPYFGLRDYGHEHQLGAEPNLDEYIENLVEVFDHLAPVLKHDGTLWLNLGDSYSSTGGKTGVGPNAIVGNTLMQAKERTRPPSDLPAKNLLGVPWRVAFALQDAGWILRADIVWAKPNPMPESVKDRPTRSHEFLFLLTRSPRYYYDAEAIKEADSGKPSGNGYARTESITRGGRGQDESWQPGRGRNKRDVWTITPKPFKGAHFAVMPPGLIEPCILAGSRPGDTVLDPFSGSATVGMVAREHSRNYVGIDTNAEYHDLAMKTRLA